MASFRDRKDAGARLASAFDEFIGSPDVVVLALPRGGVPVAYEVATRLGAPLDVLVVRKIGVPGHEELAMGAIASGDIEVVDARIIANLEISRAEFEDVVERERLELARRERVFRGDRPATDLRGKTAILIDDGLATGSTMRAAIDAARGRGAARVIAGVPVGPPDACASLAGYADQMICLVVPAQLYAIGLAYEDFSQTSDAEVRELLERAARPARPGAGDATSGGVTHAR